MKNSRIAGSRHSFLQKSGLTAIFGISRVLVAASTPPAGHKGSLKRSPPHADPNLNRAITNLPPLRIRTA